MLLNDEVAKLPAFELEALLWDPEEREVPGVKLIQSRETVREPKGPSSIVPVNEATPFQVDPPLSEALRIFWKWTVEVGTKSSNFGHSEIHPASVSELAPFAFRLIICMIFSLVGESCGSPRSKKLMEVLFSRDSKIGAKIVSVLAVVADAGEILSFNDIIERFRSSSCVRAKILPFVAIGTPDIKKRFTEEFWASDSSIAVTALCGNGFPLKSKIIKRLEGRVSKPCKAFVEPLEI